MKIGVSMIISSHSIDITRIAQKAESLGFESLWLPEHPVIPVQVSSRYPGSADGAIPAFMHDLVDPFIGLAQAAAVTRTIKLGTGICLVPERHPLLLAKEIATLDHLSHGRFLFGIGAGWLQEETEIMGGNFAHRWSQTREAILAMKELWSKDAAEYHGTFYNFPPVRSFPKPSQQPHPRSYSAARPAMCLNAWSPGAMAGCRSGSPLRRSKRAVPLWMHSPRRLDATPIP